MPKKKSFIIAGVTPRPLMPEQLNARTLYQAGALPQRERSLRQTSMHPDTTQELEPTDINSDGWNEASEPPKHDGDYECKIKNNGREFIGTRRCLRGYWFGGCRPFSEDEIIVAWRVRAPK